MALALLTALLALHQTSLALAVLQLPADIADAVLPAPAWQAAMSLVWASAFFLVTVGLLKRQASAARWARTALIVFIFYSGLRLWSVRADYDQGRLPLLGSVMIISIILLGWHAVRQAANTQNTGESKQDGDQSAH